jgi:hypothetical protein
VTRSSDRKGRPTWDRCFDPKTVRAVNALVPKIYAEIQRASNTSVRRWPSRIECMSKAEIAEGSSTGAGHGLYYPDEKRIKLNAAMPPWQILANFVHENCHHACPELAEHEIREMAMVVTQRVEHRLRANPRTTRVAARLARGGR